MAEYAPHGNPGSMLDTTKRDPPEVTNLQPSRRGKRQGAPATQALAKLKGAKKRKKKRRRRGKGTRLNGDAIEALRGARKKKPRPLSVPTKAEIAAAKSMTAKRRLASKYGLSGAAAALLGFNRKG